jgi:hypothetical protein
MKYAVLTNGCEIPNSHDKSLVLIIAFSGTLRTVECDNQCLVGTRFFHFCVRHICGIIK